MALKRDVYRELEDILGPENISEDLAVLDGYAFQPMQPMGEVTTTVFYNRPEAVVLPGSTEEVQAIIKLCNRRGIQSKAFCTGYGALNALLNEGVVLIDLRRMNRILEIDEKNMFIVVEPYVSFAQVQAEAMKRGMNCHIIGAGSQTSFLASMTSVAGSNIQGISLGHSNRNLLGVEWVLPTGEIARLGSIGSGAGWFSGDGPGPSLRGIMRGPAGACGGLGVFTKCACHLHPWPGPVEMDIKGPAPNYETELPPFSEYHICEFPSWERFADAIYKIGESGVAFALHKTGGPGSHGAYATGSNNEYYERRQAGELLIPRISFAIVQIANSKEEHEYQVKVLDTILAETEGKISPVGEEPIFKKRDILHLIKVCHIERLPFRQSGTFGVDGMIGMDTMDHAAMGLKIDEAHRDKYAKKGVIVDDGTLNSWGVMYEGTHFGHFECGQQFSPTDEESIIGMGQMIREGFETALKVPFAVAWCGFGAEGWEVVGPLCSNVHLWMRKIKNTFDPNTVSDPNMYISPKEK